MAELAYDAGLRKLHPVFGPGEDRNKLQMQSNIIVNRRCTRSSDRVRIATAPSARYTV